MDPRLVASLPSNPFKDIAATIPKHPLNKINLQSNQIIILA